MRRNQIIIIIVVLWILGLTIPIEAKENIDLGPSLEILTSEHKEVEGNILNEKGIILRLRLTNNLAEWLCWEQWSHKVDITHNGKTVDGIQNNMIAPDCLAPNSRKEYFIPYEYYNQLSQEDRIGDWRFSPSLLYVKNVDLLNGEDASNYKQRALSIGSSQGNIKEIKVQRKDPEISPSIGKAKEWWEEWVWPGIGVIGAILGIIVAILTIRHFMK